MFMIPYIQLSVSKTNAYSIIVNHGVIHDNKKIPNLYWATGFLNIKSPILSNILLTIAKFISLSLSL